MNLQEIIDNFDTNGAAEYEGIFGLPFDTNNANIVLLPVPWEATVSYGHGTVDGPQAILEASYQVDLFDPHVKDAWKAGIAMDEISEHWVNKSKSLIEKHDPSIITPVSHELNNWVAEKATTFLNNNKLVGLIGGEHSSPYGLIKVLSEKHKNLSILQVDAHADLRIAYEDFEHSHASIMYNVIQLDGVKKLTQVGIRDYCDQEAEIINNNNKVTCFFDHEMKSNLYGGENWKSICTKIINSLTDEVYISFDIDGLDPKLCPHTGTPVPGGLEYEQAVFLLNELAHSGKKIVGFDLSEVAPGEDEWDGNVGARMLYKLCNFMSRSNGLI